MDGLAEPSMYMTDATLILELLRMRETSLASNIAGSLLPWEDILGRNMPLK